jgi:hypothetical protein
MGPRADLDDVEKRKFLTLLELELQPSVLQPVASCYTDYAILAPASYNTASSNLFICYLTMNSQHKGYLASDDDR